jgi:endoglucanase
MEISMKSLIKKLVEAVGPSGYEGAVREIIKQEVAPLADELQVDALGNLIARKGHKTADGLKVMLAAHMDEIGLIVTHVDENGFVRFTSIGGVYPRTLFGGRVHFLNGTPGVIGGERLENATQLHSLEKMYIDVGATSPETCPVKIGDLAIFERPMIDLGERLVAKAMDDRISVAVLIEVMRKLNATPHDLYFVFTAQEEVGTRGAGTAAYGIDPDLGIAVDVTMTGDTPKSPRMAVKLGAGPAIKVRDVSMLSDPRVVRWMADTAESLKIPYQMEILEAGSTDARAIQVTRAGVPVGCISIPCRYVHSPSEMVDIKDVENSVNLLVELLSQPILLK